MIKLIQIAVGIYISAAIWSAVLITLFAFAWLCAVFLATIAGVAA